MPDLTDTALAGPRALRAAVDFLTRLPEVEAAVSRGAGDVQRVLDDVLERVRPIESELVELRLAAESLESRLRDTEARVTELDRTATQLTEVGARLEGAVEHLLDRVPGLSSSKALQKGREVIAAVTD